MCTLRAEVAPPMGYVLHGSCGERLVIGPCEVLTEASLPEGACPDWRQQAMATYGPGGERGRYKDYAVGDGLVSELEEATYFEPGMLKPERVLPPDRTVRHRGPCRPGR